MPQDTASPEQLRETLIHRELSWLAFNKRVLEEAAPGNNPLGERLRFLAIFVNNLDEFLMVRVAGIKRLIDAGYARADAYGWEPSRIYKAIRKEIKKQTDSLYTEYEQTMAELRTEGVALKQAEELTVRERKIVTAYFKSTIFPVITPMAVDQGHPFPVLPSKTLSFVLQVEKDGISSLAILPIPTILPRVFELPAVKNMQNFILLEEIIRSNLSSFFKGYRIKEHGLFRVIRDSELMVNEEYADDLLKAIESELHKRPKARVVRLEVENGLCDELRDRLAEEYEIREKDVIRIDSILDLTCCFGLAAKISRPGLFYKGFRPKNIPGGDIFEQIRENDFIIHLPFQSFSPVVNFISSAAHDKDVLAIKMTLYRTSGDSSFIKALKAAARAGKQVTVLVEIKARFDEEANISWARELEEAGCHVIYGIPGLKIHSKIAFVVRKEEEGIRRYIHLSTGNYNENTAEVYTDIGFFTADEEFARDISDIFNVISGYSTPPKWQTVITAPDDLREFFYHLIDNEIEHHQKHGNGMIFCKMNSLADPAMAAKLYEASQAGVTIRLLVRGICCVKPGVNGLSENIEIRSIVGRFLEHSRIFMFYNNGNQRMFMSSADWMTRNFDRRIELLFTIPPKKIVEHLCKLMELYWQDNVKSRIMLSDGSYEYFKNDEPPFNAQNHLLRKYPK